MSRTQELLGALPADACESVRVALAALARKKPDRQAAAAATRAAFSAVGFPRSGPNDPFPLARELTPAQRALAELKAREDLPVFEWMPNGPAGLRWLGLAPAHALETEVGGPGERLPLWRALQDAGRSKLAVLDALPMPFALDALSALADEVWAYRISPDPRLAWKSRRVRDLAGEGRAWALGVMREPEAEGTHRLRRQLAFFALVRAGVPIEPAWDPSFPLDTDVPSTVVGECARALPPGRLEAAALPLLRKTFGPTAIQHALGLLRHHDSPELARFVVELSKRSFPKHREAEMAALAKTGAKKPGVAAVVAEARGRAPKPRVLKVIARRSPRTPGDLTPLQAKQLVAAGQRWDGKKLPVARRLSLDESDEAAIGAVLEHLVVADETGKPALDAWLYAGDSGTFFRSGTTKVVAERIQMGIQLVGKPDEALRDALGRLRESAKAARSVRAVAAATKAGKKSKKPGSSKAAEKASSRKASSKKR